jgi:hypothetical protein
MTASPQISAQGLGTKNATPDRDYHAWARSEYQLRIDDYAGSDEVRDYLRYRWLAEYLSLDRKTSVPRRLHYGLRTSAIVGGVLLPLLTSLAATLPWAAALGAVVSCIVAGSVALDGLYRPGNRWQLYRQAAEMLKSEGWMFMAGAAPYDKGAAPEVFDRFAVNVERMLRNEVQDYAAHVMLGSVGGEQKGSG